MAYLDENGLQRFYTGVKAQIDAMAGQDGDSIEVIDQNNDGNISFVSPGGSESNRAVYMNFFLDENEHLIYRRTTNAQVDFYIDNDGHLRLRGVN